MTNPVVLLAEIVEELENGSRPEGGVDDSGDVFSVGGEHLNDFGEFDFFNVKLISHDFYQQMNRGKVKPNDIIIVKDGATTGKTSFVADKFPYFPCAINEHVFRLSVKQNVADPRYVFYYLYGPKGNREILDDFRGATVGGISQDFVNKVFIPLPPLHEQRRIVNLLARADRLRHLRRYSDSLSGSMLQSVFLEMFGDTVSNANKWLIKPFGALIKGFEAGVNYLPDSSGGAASDWRVLKISAVTWGDFDPTESKEIGCDIEFDENHIVRCGDLLISRANTTELVGAVSMVREIPPKVLLPDKLWRIKFLKDSIINPEYTLQALRQPITRKIIGDLATGSSGSMKNISMEKAATIPMMTPPLPQQEQFAAVVRRVESLRARQCESARQGEGLFQSLLHETFDG